MTRSGCPVDETLRAKMEALFYPIVRPEMMQSFQTKWEDWFVLEDSVEDKRAPGKLKCKLLIYYIILIIIYYNYYIIL